MLPCTLLCHGGDGVCVNEFLLSVPNADTPSMLRAFFYMFVGSTRGITLTFFSGLAEKHNISKRFGLPHEQDGCFTPKP